MFLSSSPKRGGAAGFRVLALHLHRRTHLDKWNLGATRRWPAVLDPAAVRASNNRFAGIWKLIGQETRDAKDQIVPPGPNANNAGRLGYIVNDPAGYIAVTIASPERPKFAGQQPTPQKARRDGEGCENSVRLMPARQYSCSSPPSRSRRFTMTGVAHFSVAARPFGDSRCKLRCARWPL